MKSYKIYVDDVRKCPDGYDAYCQSTNETLHLINRKYKEGVRHFYLDLDNDTTLDLDGKNGGDFVNILKVLDNLIFNGHYKNVYFKIHIHTGNSVAREYMRLVINHNPYMEEIFQDKSI